MRILSISRVVQNAVKCECALFKHSHNIYATNGKCDRLPKLFTTKFLATPKRKQLIGCLS